MDLLKKYLLNNIAVFAPRARVGDALADDAEPYEPDATGDDTADIEAEAAEDDVEGTEADEFEDEGEEEPEPEPRQRTRAGRRIDTLTREREALRAQVEASNARLAALEQRMAQPVQPQPDPRDEEARLALMSPEERMNYRLDRTLGAQRQETQQILATVQDQTDATAFRQLLKDKPHYAKFEKEVEARLVKLRGKGTPLPREAVLMYLVGEHAVRSTEPPRKKTVSRQRVEQQETRPGSGRGDVRGDRRQAGSTSVARERRLANVNI